jgi:penicillin-binding protein 1A
MRSPREYFKQLSTEWRAARLRHPALSVSMAAAFAIVALLSVGVSAWYLTSLSGGLPDDATIQKIGEMDQATSVFDREDNLAFTIFKEQRIEVPLTRVSPTLKQAILAIEDQRFYEHSGFDPVRIVGAAMRNVRAGGRAVQGGSTITQQLARASFLTPDKTLRRKLQEVILASRIETQYAKDRILELYLNKVYFGNGLHGVEAASRGYFNKHASELTLPEAAMLAGLVKSPSSYAPTVSLERAIARRNVVLQAMRSNGVIDEQAFQQARASRVVLSDGLRNDEPYGLYFKEQVRRELVDRFGWERVYQGGLRVFATIDMKMQEAAEAAIGEGIAAVEKRRKAIEERRAKARREPLPVATSGNSAVLQGALVALDPDSGHVRAMVGGRDFNESSFNRAVQAQRQPGSAFKPFVFAAALEAGFTPATMIRDLNVPIDTLEGAWTPDDEHSEAEALSLRAALRMSSNRAAVRLLQQVGIPRTVQYAKSMGVGDVPSVPSLALGSGEVTLQSMTAAYAAFARDGSVPKPVLVRRVEDADGRVLYASEESSTRAIKPTTAYLMATMLADVINAGTGARARGLGFTLPAAGKTGTTNDFHDAWFVGFTPKLVAGVWVGFDAPQTILPNGYAGDVAVPVWASFMKAATKGDKPQWLSPPSGLTTATVCRLSGRLATDACRDVEVIADDGRTERRSMIYTEYFVRGTQPDESCDLHQPRGLLTSLASVFTGGEERPAPPHVQDTGLPAAPAAAAAATPAPQTVTAEPVPPEAPRKKRGFWSRLFGVGRDDDRGDKNDKDDEQDEQDEREQRNDGDGANRRSGRP